LNLKYYLRGLGIGIAVTTLVVGFALNNSSSADISDSEIIARAEALGMVMEDKVLVKQDTETKSTEDVTNTTEEATEKSDDAEADKKADEETEAEKKAEEEAEAKKKAEEEAEAEKKAEEEAEAKKKAEEEAAAKKKAEEEAAAKKKAEEEAAAKKKAEEEAVAKKKAEEEAATQKAEVPANGTIIIVNVKPGSGSETVSAQLYKAGLVDNATSFNAYLCSGGYDRRLTTGDHSVPVGSSYAEIAKIMTSSTKKK